MAEKKKAKSSAKSSGEGSRADELRKRMAKNASKLSDIKKSNQEDDDAIGWGNRGDFLDFEDGKTCKFRFFPSHEEGEKFFRLRKRYWLPREDDKGDISRTTVLDSKQHGGTAMDIVDEYRKLANKNLKGDEKGLKKINDTYGGGIAPSIDWVAYALKVGKEKREFGELAFKKTVRDEINKINFIEEDDEPVEAIDVFTGEGYPLLVKYLSKPNKKKGEDYYACQKGKQVIDLEDEEIIKWGDAKPLSEIYDKVYTLKDFEKALDCLRVFDETEEFGIFDDDRWEDIVEEVKAQYDEEDDDDEEDEKPKKKKPAASKKKKVVEEEDEDEDEDDDDDDDDSDEDEDEEEEEEAPKKKAKKEEPKKKPVKKEEPKKAAKKSSKDDDEDEDEEDEKPKKKGPSIEDIRARLKKKKK